MKIVAVIMVLALAATVLAGGCDFDESKYSIERQGLRSAVQDDAQASASCLKDETLVACRCQQVEDDPEPCDGSSIRETADGFLCVARNNHDGLGVIAVATCQKTVITCESDYGNMPSISCPEFFRPISCTMHSSFMHQLNDGRKHRPVSKRSGNRCFTSRGCTNCRVQARCIRKTEFKIQKNRTTRR